MLRTVPISGAGGAASGTATLSIAVTDGTNTVTPLSRLYFAGAAVSGAGDSATVTVSSSGGGIAAPGNISLSGSSYLNGEARLTSAPAGTYAIIAPAVGKRLLVQGMTAMNTGAGSATVTPCMMSGGIIYPLFAPTGINPSLDQSGFTNSYVFEGTETFGIVISGSAATVNVSLQGINFDNTIGFKTARLTSAELVAGNNTVYVCPGGKTALLMPSNQSLFQTPTTMFYYNASGATQSYTWFICPSGGSATTSTQITRSGLTNANNTKALASAAATLGAGAFVAFGISNATDTQLVWVTVQEI